MLSNQSHSETQSTRELRSHDTSTEGTAAVWYLIMDGVHPDLLLPGSVTQIVQAQSDPFIGKGDTSESDIFLMQPMLTVEESLQGSMYREALNAGLFE